MSGYAGKTAIVTGAASGIGLEIARQLAAAGAHVLVTDLAGSKLADAVAGISATLTQGSFGAKQLPQSSLEPGTVTGMALDVTDRAAVQAAVDRVVAEHGRLDLMFNNAGVAIFGEVDVLTLDDADTIIDVNLRGVVYGVMTAYRQMVRQGHGHIVNTASVAGLVPVPLQAHYCATKSAVVGLSKALALEADGTGVSVTVFCPAFVESGMFDNNVLRGSMFGVDARAIVPIKPLDTAVAVRRLLRGIEQHRRFVVTPFYGRLGWWLERFSPTISHHFHRISFNVLRKRLGAAGRA